MASTQRFSSPIVITAAPGLTVTLSRPPMVARNYLAGSLYGSAGVSGQLSSRMLALLAGSALGSGAGVAALRAVLELAGSASGVGSAIGALTITPPFSPSQLFSVGELGAVYSAYDKSQMFQDQPFSVPVTAAGQPISVLLNKRQNPGQSTATPRRNLMVASNDWQGGGAILQAAVPSAQMDLARPYTKSPWFRIVETAATAAHTVTRNYTHAGGQFTYGVIAKAAERSKIRLYCGTNGVDTIDFDLAAGTVVANNGAAVGAIVPIADGAYLCTGTVTKGAATLRVGVAILDDAGTFSYTGDTSKGVLVAGQQAVAGATWGEYQAVGNSVAGWLGDGVMSCDTDAKRPTYVETGSIRAVRFDGATQTLWSDAFDMYSPSGISTWVLAATFTDTSTDNTGARVPISHGPGSPTSAPGARELLFGNVTPGVLGAAIGIGPTGSLYGDSYDSARVPRSAVVIVEFNWQATGIDRVKIQVNGVDQTLTQAAATGALTAAAVSAITSMSLGARTHSTLFMAMDMHECWFINRQLSGAEKVQVLAYCAPLAGVTLPDGFTATYTPTAEQFADTGFATDAGGYFKTSPFARIIFDTSAKFIRLNMTNDLYGVSPALTEVGIYVNGAFHASVPFGVSGDVSKIVELPSGAKRVEVVNGFQNKSGSTVLGSYIKSVDADAAITPVAPPSRATSTLIYADSIHGANAKPATRYSHVMLNRVAAASQTLPQSVGTESYGNRSLYDDCNTPSLRAALVARIVTWNPTRLLIEIGTNDYGLNKWSAASFGTAYAALLDDLHAALPSLVIEAVTPLVRGTETANTFGNTLAAYRSQIATAVSGRSFATLRDGAAIMTTASLTDGIHPGNAGMDLFSAAERGWLGL